MKNEFSRRDFLRLSGAVLATAALTGTLTGCGGGKPAAVVEPFGKELTAGGCKVTFLKLEGTSSVEKGGAIYEVLLKVENTNQETVTLKKEDFKVTLNGETDVLIHQTYNTNEDGYVTPGSTIYDTIPIADGASCYMVLNLEFPVVYVDLLEKLVVSVTIGKDTVRAVGTRKDVKLHQG